MTQALVVNSASTWTLSSPARAAPNCNVTGVAASSSTSPLSGDCGSSSSMLSKLSVSESTMTWLAREGIVSPSTCVVCSPTGTTSQYALTIESGGECLAHALQTLTDLDDRATVLSIDGIGAFDP